MLTEEGLIVELGKRKKNVYERRKKKKKLKRHTTEMSMYRRSKREWNKMRKKCLNNTCEWRNKLSQQKKRSQQHQR
jgi:hypothetical protein